MADSTAPADTPVDTPEDGIQFIVKQQENKYSLTLPLTTTIADVKAKIAEQCTIPAASQRLIYSGRVMKNEETLATYNVKAGNTIHLVRAATSSQAATASSAATSTPAAIPRLSTSTGTGIASQLTGAQYTGVPLPPASMFGPDGGMIPPDPESFATALENPMLQSQINEMLRNPDMLDFIIRSNPVLQSLGPGAREMMQSDAFRRMMTDPNMLRQAAQMRAGATVPSFPAPGATDNTPTGAAATQSGSGGATSGAAPSANPFASLFGGAGNPFAGAASGGASPFGSLPQPSPQEMARAMEMLGMVSPGGANAGGASALQQMLREMGMPPAAGGEGAGAGGAAANPFAGLFSGGMPSYPQAPADNRPPEERYAEQLRQLNDMGFFDFEANVAALRRSGGSVQGAINQLLGG
ncbi:putative ubiquitin-like protein DskB [Pyronema omphalodes]|nr:putative ubiquitin-like protein DskB [Pyronema omphalodes]